jgi:diguanylate cyclase
MNATDTNDATYWRERYSRLLAEFEQVRENTRGNEAIVSRLLGRVCSAVIGLDGGLDEALGKVRDLVKAGTWNEATRDELERLSETMCLQVRDTPSKQRFAGLNADAIFTFLYSYLDEEAERQALNALKQKLQNGEFSSESDLFNALERQLENIVATRVSKNRSPKGIRPGLLSRLFDRTGNRQSGNLELDQIKKNLITLLEVIATPAQCQLQANALKERLGSKSLEALQLLTLFEEVLEFLVKIRDKARDEQQSLEAFLSDLKTSLDELGRRALGMQSTNQEFERSTSNFHEIFERYIDNLRTSGEKASDLRQLKSLLSDRLDTLASCLAEQQAIQTKLNQDAREHIDNLSGRLQQLESETTELRTRLKIEHSTAMRDSLTGLPNRLAYVEYINQEIARLHRFHRPFCLLVWDIDHFRSINDRFGHKAGDKTLVVIAETLSASIRDTDFVGRFGGEEFVMVLAGSEQDAALKLANGMREDVATCGFNSQGKPVNVSISCGITQYRDTDSLESAFERADQALFQAKTEGRNRCVVK